MAPKANSAKFISKNYLYEVDLMRGCTAFTVVAIHSLSSAALLLSSNAALIALIGHLFHYNRELFIFISGLVLTYRYFDDHTFSKKRFWWSRFITIFIPYALW